MKLSRKRKSKTKKKSNSRKKENNELKNINILNKDKIDYNLKNDNNMENELNNINYNNKNNGPNNIIAERGKNMSMISTKTKKSEKTKRNIVSKIKINKFFITFCFLCIKKKKKLSKYFDQ